MKKSFLLFVSSILFCTIFCSCSNNVTTTDSLNTVTTAATSNTISTTVTEATLAEESVPPITTVINPLTGINNLDSTATNKRPIAIMVNNNKQSLPQYGIEAADIIFEAPVEGGITRLMAVYPDFNKVPNVCSIRSCRYYYPIIANGIDAIYIHWGSDKTIAVETLNRLDITHLDGGAVGAPMFGRDAERKKKYDLEHTGYLQGSVLAKGLTAGGYRTELKEGYNKPIFNFNAENAPQIPQGTTCTKAIFNFSNAYFSTFTYDEASKVYKKQHSGTPQIDSSTGNQLSFTNVIALKTDITMRDSRNGLLNIALNSGVGKYISNGMCEDIKWSKADENSPIVLAKADGTPLSINAGKSYIGIIGNDKLVSIQ